MSSSRLTANRPTGSVSAASLGSSANAVTVSSPRSGPPQPPDDACGVGQPIA